MTFWGTTECVEGTLFLEGLLKARIYIYIYYPEFFPLIFDFFDRLLSNPRGSEEKAVPMLDHIIYTVCAAPVNLCPGID